MLSEQCLLNAGLCALVSVDGNDLTPVEAARTSYRSFTDDYEKEENENLIDYLIRKNHSTPLEFASATFYMIMPIFIARQLVRHRTASINEESLRYVEARKEFYIPCKSECKTQSKTNKQGSSTQFVEEPDYVIKLIKYAGETSHVAYESLLDTGLSKELCRTVLPLGQYTGWYWKANLRNIFGLLQLRLDTHAQEQVRVYAKSMLEQLEPYFPVCIAAWKNHVLNAVTFSEDEWKILQHLIKTNTDPLHTNKEVVEETAKNRGLRKSRTAELLKKLGNLV